MLRYRRREFDRPDRRPKVIPHPRYAIMVGRFKTMSACRCRERCAHFGVGKSAGHGGIAAIPQDGRLIASLLLDQQFDKRTAVEIDDRHGKR